MKCIGCWHPCHCLSLHPPGLCQGPSRQTHPDWHTPHSSPWRHATPPFASTNMPPHPQQQCACAPGCLALFVCLFVWFALALPPHGMAPLAHSLPAIMPLLCLSQTWCLLLLLTPSGHIPASSIHQDAEGHVMPCPSPSPSTQLPTPLPQGIPGLHGKHPSAT